MTEVHHVSGEGEDAGVVYSEMQVTGKCFEIRILSCFSISIITILGRGERGEQHGVLRHGGQPLPGQQQLQGADRRGPQEPQREHQHREGGQQQQQKSNKRSNNIINLHRCEHTTPNFIVLRTSI